MASMSSVKTSNEPFIRVRLVRFNDGKQDLALENLKLRIDTFDVENVTGNRPRFPEYDQEHDRFCFETRTKQGRGMKIDVYNSAKNTNYIYITSIEDLIRDADEVIREYKFREKGRGGMSIKLITPEDIRAARRVVPDRIRKHYGHEFLSKYFMNIPVFCAACRKILWGFGTRGYRCQLCELVIHEQCINQVTNCMQLSNSNSLSRASNPHNFLREPNFLPSFCDHDGRIIRPLKSWKCSNCGMIVHSKCKSKVAQFCGTRQEAIQMYEEWKEQNASDDSETYLTTYECVTEEMKENYQKILMDIYQGIDLEKNRSLLHDLAKTLENAQESSNSCYYNRSVVLLHGTTFYAKLGQGMSGTVYWVKYMGKDYALKALRKHRIFERNEYDCVQNERDLLVLCRYCPFIVQLYAVVHDIQRIYFFLEHASCGNFYDFLSRLEVGLDEECTQWFSGQILCALRFLHSKLIIHRDLKPENVLVMPDGHIKLADFGFAKQFLSPHDTTQTFCGTPEYIAPEIYQHLKYSFPVDCWSLGVMIYEMIMLNTPFYHSYDNEIRDHILSRDLNLPDRISTELQMILSRLLRKNPQERFDVYDLQSTQFYSSTPYSLDEIEQGHCQCPWKQPIPSHSSLDTHFRILPIHLSHIDEHSLCTTLTIKKK